MPAFQFEVTIIVQDYRYPPPPQPIPPYSGRTDVYIGTAYLDQEVSVQPGQIVTLELPSLVAQQNVRLRFDYNILQPLPGQGITVLGVFYPAPTYTWTTTRYTTADSSNGALAFEPPDPTLCNTTGVPTAGI